MLTGVPLSTLQTANAASPATLPPETLYAGTDTLLGGDDVISSSFPIGFSFTYYGNTYTQMEISTNGLVCFGGQGGYQWTEQPIPNTAVPNNCIMAFWDDLMSYDAATQPILYRTIGSAPNRETIIQWTNYGYYNSPLPMGTFQIIIYETTNNIRMQYRQLLTAERSLGQSAAIGLENFGGTAGVQFCFDSPCLTPEQSILWTWNGSTYTYNAGAAYEGVYLYKDFPPPSVPNLLSPSNGSAGVSTNPTFSWEASSSAISYNLRVSTQSNLSSPIISVDNLTSLSYAASGLSLGPTYYWGVQAVNPYGNTWSSIWSFTTAAGNSAPTALNLSNTTLSAGQPVNTVVGTLSTTDPDAGNTFTYTLVSGGGSGNNSSFNISGDQLRTSVILTSGSYGVRIRTTDQGGLYVEQSFIITVPSSNSAPTAINLSSASVAENQPTNTSVGTFSTTDPDAGDTFTYTLVAGTGDTGNTSFNISGNALRTSASFNYEGQSSYSIRVRSTDAGGLWVETPFTITITNVNEAPVITEGATTTLTTDEDTTGSLTLNATDVDSATLTWSILTQGTKGSASASGTGPSKSVSYTPNANVNGADSFVVQVSDGTLTDTITVNVTINVINDAPVITEGASASVTMSEDGNPIGFSLTLHATDVDSATLTWSIAGLATNGAASASGTGASIAVSYTPTANFNGSDSFTVQVSDGTATDSILVNVTVSSVDDPPQLIGTTPTITYTEDDPAVQIDPSIAFTDLDGPNIDGVTVAITSGYVSGQDVLEFTPSGGITGSFNTTSGVLTLSGSSSVTNYEAVLRSVSYRNTSQTPNTSPRTITFVGDNSLFNTTNGHFYEFVTQSGIAWNIANSGANSHRLYGMQGYLATITSSQENSFITGRLQGVGWIGASDAATEGTWKWVTGPENGTTFCIGATPCVVQSGQYANWNPGEPNNSGDEDYGHMIYNTAIGTRGSWNDLPQAGGTGDYSPMGYVVEYGGMPGDPTIQLVATATVQVIAVNDVPTISEGDTATVTMSEDSNPTAFSLTLHASDLDNDTITWSVSGPATNGTASASGTGTSKAISYTPAANYNGSDSFVIQVSDGNGGTDTITVNVTINAVNDAPVITEGDTTTLTTDEDTATSLTLNATDADSATLTWSILTQGTLGTASASGTGASKLVDYTPNADANGADSFVVQVSDGTLTDTITVNVTINPINDTPTDISVSGDNFDEELPSGTLVGAFSTTDVDLGQSYAYTLDDACGANNNSLFSISGDTLLTAATLDYETDPILLTVCVRSTDDGDPALSTVKAFTITVNDVNDAPTAIHLDNTSVEEEQPAGTPVGTFTTTDEDALQTFTYSLVDGCALSANDNSYFSISGDQLQTAQVLDFESTPSSLTICVQTTDNGTPAKSFETSFTITLIDVNDAPTAIQMSNTTFEENQPVGTLVGDFSTTDEDTAQTHTYTFSHEPGVCDGTDNAAFTIDGAALKTAQIRDYEVDAATYAICITSTDSGTPAYDTRQAFTIQLVDVNDIPVLVNPIPNQSIPAGQVYSYTFSDTVFFDQDGDALNFTATLTDGSALPAWLSFFGPSRLFSGTPQVADAGTLPIKVTASDGRGGVATNTFLLSVTVAGNLPPILIKPISDLTVNPGLPFSFTLPADTFIDPDSSLPLTYTASLAGGANLPAWLTFNPATLTFSGTPPADVIAPIEISVFAYDTQGGIARDNFVLSFNTTGENLAPVVQQPIADKNAKAGSVFTYALSNATFYDADGDVLMLSATLSDGSALPAWLTFNSATMTFSGTPGAGSIGALLVRVTAVDTAQNSASDLFLIAISSANSATTNRVIDAAGGSEPGSQARVIIPSGLVGADSHSYVHIAEQNDPMATPGGYESLNRFSDVKILNASGGTLTQLSQPIKVCFRLSESEAYNLRNREFAVGTSSSRDTSWTLLYAKLNTATHDVCAEVSHLSLFELFTGLVNDTLPASGFAPGVVTALPLQPLTASYQSYTDLWMEIPALNVNEDIMGVFPTDTGWDITWLGDQIGWLNSTAFPTWAGNSVLTGHVVNANGGPSVFADLHTLRYGDQVLVHFAGKKYVYEVRSVNDTVDPDSKAAFAHEDLPWLTLITCKNFDEASNTYLHRVVVRAVLIRVEEDTPRK